MTDRAYVLDTSAYSSYLRGNQQLQKWFDGTYAISVPLIAIAELRAGFSLGMKKAENERLLTRFLDASSVEVVSITLKTTEVFASLFSRAKKAGVAVGTNDLWIAAIAAEHNLPILTLDKDFERMPGVRVIKV